ncbi:hypothetical protein N7E02_19465 [Aliirhizobium terrae]|uniref:hypothetical protein n=1 Tax=Terrirhizobium terrae TaxID=2926709 RepID=UPI0025790712|nr:hypothetical protein [Rhizobium sp. CC-CFT758]WJH39069.1 hypothetical protein N7E02_19465 [Rhizobium sp. CC-CFT758]
MLFNIEFDHGGLVGGYLIPDGFSEIPHIRVSDENGEIGVFACNDVRPQVAASGRHETGMVGFRLDDAVIPHLADRKGLMIHDAKSHLLIYKRLIGISPLPRKIVRLETQLLPMIRFDQHCGRFFQYELFASERLGHETTLQVFHLNAVGSIYLSGRLLMRNYEEFLAKGFEGIVMLPDPYYEMAVRIFLLKRMAKTPISFIGERDRLILGTAAEYFAEADLDDLGTLRSLLKKAPSKVTSVLSSPITRQLTTTTPEQRITRREIAPAIDLLSQFTVVGHHQDAASFRQAVGEMLGIPTDELVIPPQQMLLKELADRLRMLPLAELMLEEDLIFDHYVRQAMMSARPNSWNEDAH